MAFRQTMPLRWQHSHLMAHPALQIAIHTSPRNPRVIARGCRRRWTALALLAVLSLSGHLLLEWSTDAGGEQAEKSLRHAFSAQDCPLCRLLALGAADYTPAAIPATTFTAARLLPQAAVTHPDATPLTSRPRAPPV